MRMPQIRLQSEMARLDIKQFSGQLHIRQPKADLLIEQPKAEFNIQTTPSKLTIDQTQAWEDMNLMSTPKFVEKIASEGAQSSQEGAGRRAEQGNQLMRIETDSNPIVEQALINGHDQMKSISLKYIPSTFSVKTNFKPAQLHIDAQMNKPIINAQQNNPEVDFERGAVHIKMKQYENLHIDFVNLFTELV